MSQTFWTIFAGVTVFVIGQIIQNFILKPIQDLKRVIGEISHKAKFHSNVITNSNLAEELVRWASGDMRDLSCQLESRYVIIPFNSFFGFIKLIPKKENIRDAAKYLIYLSNAGGRNGSITLNNDTLNKLKKCLNIEL